MGLRVECIFENLFSRDESLLLWILDHLSCVLMGVRLLQLIAASLALIISMPIPCSSCYIMCIEHVTSLSMFRISLSWMSSFRVVILDLFSELFPFSFFKLWISSSFTDTTSKGISLLSLESCSCWMLSKHMLFLLDSACRIESTNVWKLLTSSCRMKDKSFSSLTTVVN